MKFQRNSAFEVRPPFFDVFLFFFEVGAWVAVEAFASFPHGHALIDGKHDTCKEIPTQRWVVTKFPLRDATFFARDFLHFRDIARVSEKITL